MFKMKIIAIHSHKDGLNFLKKNHPTELEEIKLVIKNTDAKKHRTKTSKEITMKGKKLYAPKKLNIEMKEEFEKLGWKAHKISVTTKVKNPPYKEKFKGSREVDFLKNKVGVEVQFGKYAFMAYDMFSKMPIFHKQGLIDCGVEIVPMQTMMKEMSTGVSSYQQILCDFDLRGEADIDIPTVVIGIEP